MDTSLKNKELAEKFYQDIVQKLLIGNRQEISDVDIVMELVSSGVPKGQVKAVSEIVLGMMEEKVKIVTPIGVKRREYSKKSRIAPISSISSILLGGIIALVATFSFMIDILTTRNPVALLLDITVMAVSYLTIWQGIYYTIIDRVAKERMEEQWEYKIKPIIDLLTENAGRIDAIEEEICATNRKVSTTMDYVIKSQTMDVSKTYILPGTSFKFISKILVLIFFTFSSLVYVSSYPLGIVHYFILLIYLIWWVFITAEYKQFGSTAAWVWAIAPIMIIPTTGIMMSSIYGLNITIGILFAVLLVYVYSYYAWACYVSTGYKLLDLDPIIYQIKNSFKKSDGRRCSDVSGGSDVSSDSGSTDADELREMTK